MKLRVSFKENNTVLGGMVHEMQAVTIIDSPAFTGTPTAPTPTAGSNNQQLATTEFVTQAIAMAHIGYGNIVLLNTVEVTS